MAQLIPYLRKKGTTYGVKWRAGGNGKTEHETFSDEKQAKFFKADVERCGHQYPPNFVPKLGYVDPEELAKQKARLAAETEAAKRAKPVYFSDRYEAFLSTRTAVEARSVKDYRNQFTNHLLPAFGHLVVNDAAEVPEEEYWDGDKVKAWVNNFHHGLGDPETRKWKIKPHAPKTVRNLHALLSSYGAWLVEKKLRAANPCAGTRLPESEEGDADVEMVFLEVEEYANLREYFTEQEAVDLADFMAGCGARYGEATALKIKDLVLDPENDTPHLRIRRAWKRQPNGSHKLGRPKSKASRRRVELADNDYTIALLKRVSHGREPEEFVFLTPTGVHWRHANFYNRPWLQALYKAARCERHRLEDGITNMHDLKRRHVIHCGCPGTTGKIPRIHDLRHSNAAWLIEKGVSLLAIQRQFGHESYHTTEKRYGHLTSAAKRAMGAAANSAMSAASGFSVGFSVGESAAGVARRTRGTDKQIRRHRMFGVRGAPPLSRAAG